MSRESPQYPAYRYKIQKASGLYRNEQLPCVSFADTTYDLFGVGAGIEGFVPPSQGVREAQAPPFHAPAPNKVRALRDAEGWSLRELARRSSVDSATLNRLERGTQPLDINRMRAIAKAFGLKASQLLPDEDVALREDAIGVDLVHELNRIPEAERPAVLRMAREIARVVKTAAADLTAGGLEGDRRQVSALAALWNGVDDEARERALRALKVWFD